MSVIEAVLWGILQGLTEFLPVSSSGHLVLVPWLTGREPSSFTFDILVHFGTLFAILIYFRQDLRDLIDGGLVLLRTRSIETPEARLAWLILLSLVPAALVVLLFRHLLIQLFSAPPAAAALLLVTGTAMFLAERYAARERGMECLHKRESVIIGVAQSVALAPGISRSGATISTGLALGLRRPDAARFSFLMAIPAILGATLLEFIDLLRGAVPDESTLVLAAGFMAALISGYLAIALLLRHLQRRGLRPFAYYCWAMGLFSLIVFLVR
jgi:undecaprenyl-diphosphatase